MNRPSFIKVTALLAISILALPVFQDNAAKAVVTFPTTLSTVGQAAVQQVGSCLNSKHSLQVFYLVDASKSLRDTDKSHSRAAILAASLKSLAAVDANTSVSYAMGSFGAKFTVIRNWTSITSKNITTEAKWISETIPKLDDENITDWKMALEGASLELSRARDLKPACQVLVWLTDGGIDMNVNPAHSPNLEKTALKAICGTDPSGTSSEQTSSIIDQFRNSGVNILGVLLKSDIDMASQKRNHPIEYARLLAEMSYMQPIVEGASNVDAHLYSGSSDQVFNCGTTPISASESSGALLTASDPLTLALQFSRIIARSSGGAPGKVFGDNPAHFIVEPGIAYFDLLIASKKWILKDPSGKIVATPDSSSTTQIFGASQIRVPSSSATDRGQWTIENIKANQADVFFYTGLKLKLGAKTLITGQPATLSGQVIDRNTKPVGLSDYGKASLGVTALKTDGTQATEVPLKLNLGSGTFAGSFQPTNGQSRAIFDVTLNLFTKSGVALTPITFRDEERVGLPAEYPHIRGLGLQLSTLSGSKGVASGALDLVGSEISDGTVCLSKPVIISDPAPDRIKKFKWIKAPSSCIEVPKGKVISLKFELSNKSQSTGVSTGYVPAIFKTYHSKSNPIEQGISLHFNSQVKTSSVIRLLVLLALIFLSIFLPLLLLYLLGYLNSRMLWGENIQKATIPVGVSPSGTIIRRNLQSGAQEPLLIEAREYEWAKAEAERIRSFQENWSDGTSSGMVEISGRIPRNPFGDPLVIANAGLDSFIITSRGGAGSKFHTGKLPIDVGDFWLIVFRLADIQNQDDSGYYNGTLVSYLRYDPGKTSAALDRSIQIQNNSNLNLVTQFAAAADSTAKVADGDSSFKTKKPRGSKSRTKHPLTNMSARGETVDPFGDIAASETNSKPEPSSSAESAPISNTSDDDDPFSSNSSY